MRRISTFIAGLLALAALAAYGASARASAPETNAARAATVVAVPHKTIGYAEIQVSESSLRNLQAVKAAAKFFGWKVKFTNANGDVSVLNKALRNYVNSGVDAILTGSTDANLIRPALLAAKKRNIPWIAITGGVPKSDLFSAIFTENEPLLGRKLTTFMAKDLGGKGKIIALNIRVITAGADRVTARDKVLKAYPGIQIAAQTDGDLADPIRGTQRLIADMITAHPDVKAVWLVFDYMMPPTISALRAAGLAGKVKIYTFFAGPANAALLRDPSNGVRALCENNLDWGGLMAMDQLAKYFVTGKRIDPNALAKSPPRVAIVTAGNVPAPGKLFFTVEKDIKSFVARWKKGVFYG